VSWWSDSGAGNLTLAPFLQCAGGGGAAAESLPADDYFGSSVTTVLDACTTHSARNKVD
jgi:hypothetical protein